MGNSNRNNSGLGKRKSPTKKPGQKIDFSISQKITFGIVFIATLLFFLSSFGNSISLNFFFEGALQGILVLLAILMVTFAIHDRDEKVVQRHKKKRLLKDLSNKKKILSNRYDLQKNLTAKSQDLESESAQTSINFAEEVQNSTDKISTVNDKIEGKSIKIDSQTNLAKILIEGEDISSFPQEWQEFMVENEGKEPIEKLNKILENGQKDY